MLKQGRNKGITLVALVITIIVLLILAGITINLVFGENGIITKSMESGKVYELSSIKEQIQMEILGRIDNNLSVSYEDIDEILQKYAGENGEVIYEDADKTIPIGVHPTQYPEEEILLEAVWNGNIKSGLVTDGSFDGIVNTPKFPENNSMKAVIYDEIGLTSKPRTNEKWYNYELNTGAFGQDDTSNRQAKWANATIENGSYFVWIPRYAYKIIRGEHESGADINPTTPTLGSGEIDIIFLQGTTNKDKSGNEVPSDYIVHPAFDFGGAKEGIWVGKYESSNDGSGKIKIVPNIRSYTINISSMFAKSQAMAGENGLTNVDAHMMKNTEWGCVAYLAHSKYGRNGIEVTINNHSGQKTGFAGGSISARAGSSEGTDTFAYNTPKGQLASTTGNITGIYDMSGGAEEYVMGLVENTVASSGFTSLPADTKYYDSYIAGGNNTLNYAQNTNKKGDAIYETSSDSANPWTLSWFSDKSIFLTSTYPFFARGGYSASSSDAGLFAFNIWQGGAYSNYSFRVVLVP